MDKTAIKNYAITARRRLIEAVKLKAQRLYIFENGALPPDEAHHRLRAEGIYLTSEQNKARLHICNILSVRGDDIDNESAYHRLAEEIAYTWFNRLIALRFMEINDYLPSGIRILSSIDKGRIEPDALREVDILPYVDKSKVEIFRNDTAFNAPEKLYRYILISQCNALSDILPGMFQKIDDYTELLLPDNLYTTGGIVYELVNSIGEENFSLQHQGQIEIIGWLYQYYTSEKKDEVFAALKKNVKLNKDTIPAATQLFTPEWIVKYMVENSLGRLWLEKHPNENLRNSWRYYIDEAEQEPEVAEQLRILRSQSPVNQPQDIKLIDPCMGSGHVLVYAFEVLFQIYESMGYSEREIPNLILEHNLFGLDICDRAAQLAYFALMMKARSYNRRFLRQSVVPQPKVMAVPESSSILRLIGIVKYLGVSMGEAERTAAEDDFRYVVELFEHGKEYGSLIKVDHDLDYERLREYLSDYPRGQMSLDETSFFEHAEAFGNIFDAAALLARKYDVVVTNPPYMGNRNMGTYLTKFVVQNFTDSKSDLFACFIEQCTTLAKTYGYTTMITQHSWMFLSSYEKLRKNLINTNDIVNMAHLGAHAFEEIGGEVVQTTAFVLRHSSLANYLATFVRLVDFTSQQTKESMFLSGINRFYSSKDIYSLISGSPCVYWISEKGLQAFIEANPLIKYARPRVGQNTGDNDRFLRYWYEVNNAKVAYHLHHNELEKFTLKWIPYNKGGSFRRWYGNFDYVVNWENNGREIKDYAVIRNHGKHWSRYIQNIENMCRVGISWSDIASTRFGCRFLPEGFICDVKGSSMFPDETMRYYLLAFLNSKVAIDYLQMLNPTTTYQVGNISSLPLLISRNDEVSQLADSNVDISRVDWDSVETSWDFLVHPLMNSKNIDAAYEKWEADCDNRFANLKSNEEVLNRIFIDIYGLHEELTPEVEDKDITIRRADLPRDIRSFVSYAVGCMFGRYNLDEPGLAFAGGSFEPDKYKTFAPSKDNILPIGTADYFENDIVLLFIEFVRKVYGEETLGENLDFIANALYPNASGTAQERIRRYFLNEFYKDHVRIYQKRPIYWLLDSGKKNGFKALFYLHRYDKFTLARARTDYLHILQRKYEAEVKRLELLASETADNREKAASRKDMSILQGQIDECRIYDQVLAHIAHQQIELDLDDGVKVNYAKFQGVEVPVSANKVVKMDLLGRI